jgi:hypothetical protein
LVHSGNWLELLRGIGIKMWGAQAFHVTVNVGDVEGIHIMHVGAIDQPYQSGDGIAALAESKHRAKQLAQFLQ